MLVAVQVDQANKAEIMEILLNGQHEYMMFASGSFTEIIAICGQSCTACKAKQESAAANNDFYVIYALKEKSATLELLALLAASGLTKVQTAPNVTDFLNQRKIVCDGCSKKLTRPMAPPRLQPKTEVAQVLGQVKREPLNQTPNQQNTPRTEAVLVNASEPESPVSSIFNGVLAENNTPRNDREASSTPAYAVDGRNKRFFRPASERIGENGAGSAGIHSLSSTAKRARVDNAPEGESSTPVNRGQLNRTTDLVRSERTAGNSSFEESPVSLTSSGRHIKKSHKKRYSEEYADKESGNVIRETCKKCAKSLSVRKHSSWRAAMTQSICGHTRTHSDMLPFRCDACPYECRFESAMKAHLDRHGCPSFTNSCDDPEYKEEMDKLKEECFPKWNKYVQ